MVRQLCLQALQGGYSELADQARQELLTLPAARLIPRWTNIGASRALVRTLTGHDGWVTAVAITPDGTQAVTAGGYDKTLRRWDLTTGYQPGAAQTAKRHPMFAGAYAQLARRRGNNIATTAIARRLLARSFHLLTQLEATSEKAGTGRARVSA